MSKIALVEIFRSVQGEGYNAGRAAIFVRTAGCNLSCVFADDAVCDTPYQHAHLKLTLLEVMVQVQKLAGEINVRAHWGAARDARPMVILTGGEPTMAPQFDALVHAARGDGFYVAVETNGTVWRDGLTALDWICVSPKGAVPQGSPSPHHNPHPGSPALDPRVVQLVAARAQLSTEYRYVISGRQDAAPPWHDAFRHYVSPAVRADGAGMEWKTGAFPGFVPGALERCQEIVWRDPRWRISTQVHKVWGVR